MSRTNATILGLWIPLVGMILAWTVVAYNEEADAAFKGEILIRHGLLMLVLSVPSGFLLLYVFGMLTSGLGIATGGITDAALASVACGIAGYFQWFVLLPWLWGKWRSKRRNGRGSARSA